MRSTTLIAMFVFLLTGALAFFVAKVGQWFGGVGTVLTSSDGGHSFSHGMLSDRLSLSNGLPLGDRLLLVGQGGAKLRTTGGEQ